MAFQVKSRRAAASRGVDRHLDGQPAVAGVHFRQRHAVARVDRGVGRRADGRIERGHGGKHCRGGLRGRLVVGQRAEPRHSSFGGLPARDGLPLLGARARQLVDRFEDLAGEGGGAAERLGDLRSSGGAKTRL